MDATLPRPTYSLRDFIQSVTAWIKANLTQAVMFAVIGAAVTWLINLYTMASMGGFNDVPEGSPISGIGNQTNSSLIWGLGSMVVFGVVGYWRAAGTERFIRGVLSMPSFIGQVIRKDGETAYAHLLWGMAVTLVLVAFLSPWLSGVMAVGLLASLPTVLGGILVMLVYRASSTLMHRIGPGRQLAPGPLPAVVGLLGACAGLALGIFLTGAFLKILLAIGCAAGALAMSRSGRVPPAIVALATMALAVVVYEWFVPLLAMADDFGANEIPAGKTLLTSPGVGKASRIAAPPALTTFATTPVGLGMGHVLASTPINIFGSPPWSWRPWGGDESDGRVFGGGDGEDVGPASTEGPLTGGVGDEGPGLFVPPGYEGSADEGGWGTDVGFEDEPGGGGFGDEPGGSGHGDEPGGFEDDLPPGGDGAVDGPAEDSDGGWDDTLDVDSPWPGDEGEDDLPPDVDGPDFEGDGGTSDSDDSESWDDSVGTTEDSAGGSGGGSGEGEGFTEGDGASDATAPTTDESLPPDADTRGGGGGDSATGGGSPADGTASEGDGAGVDEGLPPESDAEATTSEEEKSVGGTTEFEAETPVDGLGGESGGAATEPEGTGADSGASGADSGGTGGRTESAGGEDSDDGSGTGGGTAGTSDDGATAKSGTQNGSGQNAGTSGGGGSTGGASGPAGPGAAAGAGTAPPGTGGAVGADGIDPSKLSDPSNYKGPTVPTIYGGDEAVNILVETGVITPKVDDQGNPVVDADNNPVYVPADPDSFPSGGRPINFIDGTSENAAGQTDYVHDRPITGVSGGGYKLNDDGTVDPNNIVIVVEQAAESADGPTASDIPWTYVGGQGTTGGTSGGGQTGGSQTGGGQTGGGQTAGGQTGGGQTGGGRTGGGQNGGGPTGGTQSGGGGPAGGGAQPEGGLQTSGGTTPQTPPTPIDRPADAPSADDTGRPTPTAPPNAGTPADEPAAPPKGDSSNVTPSSEPPPTDNGSGATESSESPAAETVRTPRTPEELADSIRQPGTTVVDPEAAGFTRGGRFEPPPGTTSGLSPAQQQLVEGLRGGNVEISGGRITVTPTSPFDVGLGDVNQLDVGLTVNPQSGHIESRGSMANVSTLNPASFLSDDAPPTMRMDVPIDNEINPMLNDINQTLDERGLVATDVRIDNGQIRVDTQPKAP